MVSSGCCLVSPGLGRIWDHTKRTIESGSLWMRKCREHPQVFHKTCQVGVAFIGLCYGKNPELTEKFGKLFAILQAADMHYFYAFLDLPKFFFYPVRAETIDAVQVRDAILARYPSDPATAPAVREFLDKIIEFKLNQMAGGIHPLNGSYSGGYGHASIQEFEANLLDHLCRLSPSMVTDAEHQMTDRYNINYFPSNMPPVLLEHVRTPEAVAAIENLQAQLRARQAAPEQPLVVLRSFSLLEKISTVLGGLADIGTVFWFLSQWKLVDTAKIGRSLGMKNQVLAAWVWGTYSIVHAINLTLSLKKSIAAPEGSHERSFAARDAVVSTAELALSVAWFIESAGLRAVPKRVLFGLAFVAKGLGLCQIIYKLKCESIEG